jgi:cell division protein FtsL
MIAQEFFYYALGVAVLLVAGGVLYLIYHIVQVIKEVQLIVQDAGSISHDVTQLKDGLKSGGMQTIGSLVSFFLNTKKRR